VAFSAGGDGGSRSPEASALLANRRVGSRASATSRSGCRERSWHLRITLVRKDSPVPFLPDPEGSPKRSFRTLSPVENGGAFSLMTPTSEGPISRIGIGNARGMSGTDVHHRELGNRGPAIRIELAIGNGTQSLALGPDWRWFHVNSWRVVIGDRRSLTIGAGGFEAIRYKVPGLRHGQQVARVLSALVCEPSVLFQALFVVHRDAPCQLRWLAGREHGRTIPLPAIGRIEIPQRNSTEMCYSFRSSTGGAGQ
jgi:hypothetical protein